MDRSRPLAPLTTFHIGGPARVFSEASSLEELREAVVCAQEEHLPLFVLGAGSNVLVPDEGVEGVVVRLQFRGISFEDAGDTELLIAGAGAYWEDIVDAATKRGLFGIENLAGIPGTLGGAAVQNIGAYGAEFKDVFAYADVVHKTTGETHRMARPEVTFAYRSSFFKEHREFIITQVALKLAKHGLPNTAYADIARAEAAGTPLATSSDVAFAIRAIRARKFPSGAIEGTAGSFFKNPCVEASAAHDLGERFPGLPTFPQENGTVKIPLAWILDHALSLKGYEIGRVRLYENQPLVVVAKRGATAGEVNAFVDSIVARVREATGVIIEREVETFGAR